MITALQHKATVKKSIQMMKNAGIVLTGAERAPMEVAGFGLGELEKTGLEILTYLDTERVCAKEIIMFPRQTCPEHRHPTVNGRPGKEETFRCRWGTVYLYVPGEPSARPKARPPAGSEVYDTVQHEVCLKPGEQYTLM